MAIFDKPKKLFEATVPDLYKFIGKTVVIPNHGKVTIKTIVGNKWKQKFYEINGDHLISMLRFHAQMERATDITEDQFLAFEEMDVECEKLPPAKPIKDVTCEQTNQDFPTESH